MATIECHYCGRQIDDREIKWFRPFGGGAQPGDDNALEINAAVTDRPVDGSEPICPTCLADMNAKRQPGHTLVIEKDGGHADVRKMSAADYRKPHAMRHTHDSLLLQAGKSAGQSRGRVRPHGRGDDADVCALPARREPGRSGNARRHPERHAYDDAEGRRHRVYERAFFGSQGPR